MKKTRKLTSIVLLIAMLFLLAAPAMATGTDTNADTGSITIDNAVVGQTYTIYRIFDLESYDAASNAYAYKVNANWNDFFNENAAGRKYVTIDDNGYVTWQESASVADFAAAAKAYAETPNSADSTETKITPIGSKTAGDNNVTFSNLNLGYYLIASDLGVLCALDTTNPNATVKEKNDGTTLTKKVSQTSASIGDKVDFTITLTIHETTAGKIEKSYVVHDKMDAGFTFDENSVNVSLYKAEGGSDSASSIGYSSSIETDGCEQFGEGSPCTFEVKINENTDVVLENGDEIVITYKATLNEQATIGEAGNINRAKLANSSYIAETKTCTWDVDIFKYTATQDADGLTTEKALADATFTLRKNAGDTSLIPLVKRDTNLYRVATTNDTTEVTTDATGKFTIEGLGAGSYSLTETKSPAGYNKLSEPITIIIAENGQITIGTDKEDVVTEVKVLNQTGNELPSTGGMGTTIFYVVGGVLVVGAGVLLVTRKRMNAEK